jgi:hypothetical protein
MMGHGAFQPQTIFSRRKFRRVLLNPPSFQPGSWCGAGKLWVDAADGEYLLTSRPREGGERRGYAAEVYRSRDGEAYGLISSISKEEVSAASGLRVQSIENQQILRDPLTGLYHLYLSIDVAGENVAGSADRIYESRWETYLLVSADPTGPWKGAGFALRGDAQYDDGEARDCTIDIIDGKYICLYKARGARRDVVSTALAISGDGKSWTKLGIPRVQGGPRGDFFLLNGSIIAGPLGPTFMGTETTEVVKGAALTRTFCAYAIDLRGMNLRKVFSARWFPGSQYEHAIYPIHTYAGIAYDVIGDLGWMMWIEAVDPTFSSEPGLNLEVDRLLLYTSKGAGA